MQQILTSLQKDVFDIVIVGAGLGGLLCAAILAKEGKRVAIIEQNKQLGGCLQTFSIEKKIFDSCVHYIGAASEGQTQYKIFDYVGVMQQLKLQQLDNNCFDEIIFDNDYQHYSQAQGLTNFQQQLLTYFPNQKTALAYYAQTLKEVSDGFPLYTLKNGDAQQKEKLSQWKMNDVLGQIPDQKLRAVLTGNSLLYAGTDTTPYYVHALVSKSYVDSAYKFKQGSSQITKLLLQQLRQWGATVYKNEKVEKLLTNNGEATTAVTVSGQEVFGKLFISNVHPSMMFSWLDKDSFKPIYKKRILGLQNSIAAFMINIVLKPKTIPYQNSNVYWNRSCQTLTANNYSQAQWPNNYALYFGADTVHVGYSDTLAILTYMSEAECLQWQHTHNRTAIPSNRDDAYQAFKQQKAEQLLSKVAERYPLIRASIKAYSIATPLTYRDYMGSPDGSMYGIMPNVTGLAQSRVPIRTQIPNLLMVGQNIGLHGVLGVSINAVAVCGEILGLDYLLQKINK